MKNSTQHHLPCFKAYDIRGRVPEELDEELAFRIGQAYASRFLPSSVAIGYDIRLSSPSLAQALTAGFLEAGVNVLDLGQCGTEEIYFASFNLDVDGAIIVTASHNPADYNGMKLVLRGGVPISGDTGLHDLEKKVIEGQRLTAAAPGKKRSIDNRSAYIQHLLTYIDRARLKPLKLVVNPGNGCAGPVINALEKYLPFTFIKIQDEPDGSFPNGVPNPLLPENRQATGQAVRDHGADLGIAWDGDFDRCFFFDQNGVFVEGYFIVGLLAQAILQKNPGAKIIHDPRLVWNTQEVVLASGGVPVMSKTGHAFIKERMRREDAVYGGEMSAHHYFKDFSYCDSGMVPWLLMAEIISTTGLQLSELLQERLEKYPVSGEINNRVDDPEMVIEKIKQRYCAQGKVDFTDGLSVDCQDYRFNLRVSNTEPVMRLNVETRGNKELLQEKTEELLAIIQNRAD